MNVENMHIEFKVRIDKSDSLEYADFLPEEIDIFLNRAQDVITEQLYGAGALTEINELWKVWRLEYPLTSYQPSARFPNGYYVDISSITDFLYHVNSYTQVTRTSFPTITTAEYILNNEISSNIADAYAVNSYNRPTFKNPVIFFEENTTRIVLLVDYYTNATSGFYIEYIKIPTRISLEDSTDCDLNERLHRKIIDLAVVFAEKDIEKTQPQ